MQACGSITAPAAAFMASRPVAADIDLQDGSPPPMFAAGGTARGLHALGAPPGADGDSPGAQCSVKTWQLLHLVQLMSLAVLPSVHLYLRKWQVSVRGRCSCSQLSRGPISSSKGNSHSLKASLAIALPLRPSSTGMYYMCRVRVAAGSRPARCCTCVLVAHVQDTWQVDLHFTRLIRLLAALLLFTHLVACVSFLIQVCAEMRAEPVLFPAGMVYEGRACAFASWHGVEAQTAESAGHARGQPSAAWCQKMALAAGFPCPYPQCGCMQAVEGFPDDGWVTTNGLDDAGTWLMYNFALVRALNVGRTLAESILLASRIPCFQANATELPPKHAAQPSKGACSRVQLPP